MLRSALCASIVCSITCERERMSASGRGARACGALSASQRRGGKLRGGTEQILKGLKGSGQKEGSYVEDAAKADFAVAEHLVGLLVGAVERGGHGSARAARSVREVERGVLLAVRLQERHAPELGEVEQVSTAQITTSITDSPQPKHQIVDFMR